MLETDLGAFVRAIKNADFVYIAGNGGSASTANHMANDLVKLCGVKAISLCSNEAVVMAYANDDGYENVFLHQLMVFLSAKDLLITISGSGTSKNIVKAANYASEITSVLAFPTMDDLGMDMQDTETYHLGLVHSIAKELAK